MATYKEAKTDYEKIRAFYEDIGDLKDHEVVKEMVNQYVYDELKYREKINIAVYEIEDGIHKKLMADSFYRNREVLHKAYLEDLALLCDAIDEVMKNRVCFSKYSQSIYFIPKTTGTCKVINELQDLMTKPELKELTVNEHLDESDSHYEEMKKALEDKKVMEMMKSILREFSWNYDRTQKARRPIKENELADAINCISTYGDILSDDESPPQVGSVVHGGSFMEDYLKDSHSTNKNKRREIKIKYSKN